MTPTPDRPYFDSEWNRPLITYPTFTDIGLTATGLAGVNSTTWSTGVYVAQGSDIQRTVYPNNGRKQMYNVATGHLVDSVTLRWPHDTTPAEGSDGHCVVIFENQVWSFQKLAFDPAYDRWTCELFAEGPSTALNGSGFATVNKYGAKFPAGVCASGASPLGGLIRTWELAAGKIDHVLSGCISPIDLAPSYVHPAIKSDAPSTSKGLIPMGALLALHGSFDASGVTDPVLLMIVDALKSYGARVIDQCGAPFEFMAERGSGAFAGVALESQTELIRAGLRMIAP